MSQTKETRELLVASGDVAVVIYKAQKKARSGGKLDVGALGQAIAAELMMKPSLVEDIKNGIDGIQLVPLEIKALGFVGAFELVSVCGEVAGNCIRQINEA